MLKLALGSPRRNTCFHARAARDVGRARKALALCNPGAPVLLIDHCDN
jgi:hypothetical protein